MKDKRPVPATEKKTKYDLACLGIAVVDVFGKPIDKFPEKGTTVYFDGMEIHTGGCALNTGIDAAKIGMDVAVLGAVGNDFFGNVLMDTLRDNGVDTKGVVRKPQSTGFSFVMVPPDGSRRIYHTRGANSSYCLADVEMDIVRDSKILHVAGASLLPAIDGKPTADLLKKCQSEGILTSMDPVYQEGISECILPCLEHLDIFLPNNDESKHITGLKIPSEQLRFYLDHGVKIAGIKMGEKGVLVSDGTEVIKLGIYSVESADTCGAGDAFISGFLFGKTRGWNIEDCAKFATAVAAFCVQSVGTTTGIPKSEKIRIFMNDNKLTQPDCPIPVS